ncbi:MAG: MFS transporter [Gammaproteobacteria bacterium]|nr:MFS transporter [Gammaproteobacteria bacterium]
MRNAKRNVALLALCQALFMTGTTLLIASSALVGLSLSPNSALATVPLGVQFFASMATALPASLLMRRIGRRNGLLAGLAVGLIGGLTGALAIVRADFTLFVLASALLGVHNGFCQFYRFAAAEVAGADFRSRAISLVMAGGVVAAFAGPALAYITRDLSTHEFAASFASLNVLQLISAALLFATRIPADPPEARATAARSIGTLAASPAFLAAVACAMIGYGSMNLLMTATPLAMRDAGFGFGHTTWVIQWHVFGMFAPAFFTGHLIARFGTDRIIGAGCMSVAACVLINLTGAGMVQFWSALVLLGLGWNFMFVGATTAVAQAFGPEDKARAQGLNDLLVFGVVAITATSSGAAYHWLGWSNLNLLVAPGLVVALAVAFGTRLLPRTSGTVPPDGDATGATARPR